MNNEVYDIVISAICDVIRAFVQGEFYNLLYLKY